ncbi:MAG: hypothetical protein J6X24_03455 [Firmicutes bacterium]|nr:hypothetical protein [Bacillota bacterium]
MYGANATLQAQDTSSFVSIGEHMLRTGYTNTLNALSTVIARTIVAVRPYRGKFEIIARVPEEWGGITRKISFYAGKFEAETMWNTDINATNLVDGNSIDHYKIPKTYPLEMNFCGTKVIKKRDTTFADQLDQAFHSESEFSDFYSAKMIAIANDIALGYEAENRLQILNAIGSTYNTGGTRQKVNLVAAYNAKFGTSYTATQLLTTYLKEFCEFFVARIKGDMSLMSEYNSLFHIFPARNDDGGNALTLLRHTPAEMRRLILFQPIFRDAEARVFPSLFDPGFLRMQDYEGVEYWQNPNVPSSVNIKPNQLNVSTGQAVDGTAVSLDTVVGLLFDRDAIATSLKLQKTITTPVNADGDYFNTVYHWAFQFKEDPTENMVLYYMA